MVVFQTYWSSRKADATSIHRLTDDGIHYVKVVLIKHNPQGHHLISHLVPVPYVRPIFVFQTLSVWRSPVLHFIYFAQHEFARWDNVHDFTSVFYPSETLGHIRVLLAFFTPSVTSKRYFCCSGTLRVAITCAG